MVRGTSQPAWLLLAVAVVAIAVYWPGLSGPFLFDDVPVLAPVQAWARGELSLHEAIVGQQSLLLARPLAMLTFAANAWANPADAFAYKTVNLALHLICGLLTWRLARRLYALHASTQVYAEWLAAVVAAAWLLHPFHASTVLYVVQRMMQLATLLTLLALLAYVKASTLPDATRKTKAWPLMFAVFPCMVALGILSKQTAATAPLICLAIACAYFPHQLKNRRQQGFYLLFLCVPSLALGIALTTPLRHALLAGYMDYDFTLLERLGSQPAILLDYVGQLLFPREASMGLYGDDVSAPHGQPSPTWLLGGLLLTLITAGLVALRRRSPAMLAGWLMFLAAHTLESSFLPLDLYFEHRNYLASFGILFATVGAGAAILGPRLPRTTLAGGVALLLVALALSTYLRAITWSSKTTLATEGLALHPNSLRAHLDVLDVYLQGREVGPYMRLTHTMTTHANPEIALAGHAYRMPFQCLAKQAYPAPAVDIDKLTTLLTPRVTLNDELSLRSLISNSRRHCSPEVYERIIEGVSAAVTSLPHEARAGQRYIAIQRLLAQEFFSRGLLNDALAHQREAWQASSSTDDLVAMAELQARIAKGGGALTSLREAARNGACATPALRDRIHAVVAYLAVAAPGATTDDRPPACPAVGE